MRWLVLLETPWFLLAFSVHADEPKTNGTVNSRVATAGEIRSLMDGTWVITAWHRESGVRRPSQTQGYASVHDGIWLFMIDDRRADRTET